MRNRRFREIPEPIRDYRESENFALVSDEQFVSVEKLVRMENAPFATIRSASRGKINNKVLVVG